MIVTPQRTSPHSVFKIIRSWGPAFLLLYFAQSMACWLRADEERSTDIRQNDLKRHAGVLSADSFQGRRAGSAGGQAASAYLISELKKWPALRPGNDKYWGQEFEQSYRNVLALLPGSDPQLRDQVVVIGAHYDHVGLGGQNLSDPPYGRIHNGADDNASGTSALLELAEHFAAQKPAPKRTILFAFWDAEEIGLVGSKFWVRNPTVPLDQVKLAINLDMVGRLKNDIVYTVGWRTGVGLRPMLVNSNHRSRLRFGFKDRVPDDTDHYWFFKSSIPVFHFDTGLHEDYHRPSDDADKLNYEGMEKITKFAAELLDDCANRNELPAFVASEPLPEGLATEPGDIPSPRRLRLNWQEPGPNEVGVLIEKVESDGPAYAAGLRSGDRLLRIAGWNGGTSDDLRTAMVICKQSVTAEISEGGTATRKRVQIHLHEKPLRLGITYWSDPVMLGAIRVRQVTRWSPAYRAGLKQGDYITSINGTLIDSSETFTKLVAIETDQWTMTVDRAGLEHRVDVPTFRDLSQPADDLTGF